MEYYKVFYHNGEELKAYELDGDFKEKEIWTKDLLACSYGIKTKDIKVFIEKR